MGREMELKQRGGTALEFSAAEGRLIAERLRALYERWAARLEDDAKSALSDLSGEELENLYDNLAFDADFVNEGRTAPEMEEILAKIGLALDEASGEDLVPADLLPLYQEIVGLTDQFCQERLNDEYRLMCRRAAVGLCQNGSPVVRGKRAGWASGVVAAVGWVNFLNDPSQDPHVRSEEIAEWFGVSVATMQSKSKTIREGLDLMPFDPTLTLPSRMADNPLIEASNMLASLPAAGAARRDLDAVDADEDLGFQLKITLRDVKPSVWRRVRTPDCPLDELHELIQATMGWHGGHLHEFRVGSESIAAEGMGDLMEAEPGSRQEADVWLSDLYADGAKKINYTYDFGDGWEHAIVIEKALPGDAVGDDPICTGGAGACPPEDVGGPWGYAEFLEAMADPKHERHAELKEWYGEDFDPKRFDVKEVNRLLAR